MAMCEIRKQRGKYSYRLCADTADPMFAYLASWGEKMSLVAREIAENDGSVLVPGLVGTMEEYAKRTSVAIMILDTLRGWHPFATYTPRGIRGRVESDTR